MCRKWISLLVFGFLLGSPFFSPLINLGHNKIQSEEVPSTSDIAGTDLYSENIDAYVAGNKSIIKQSLFTNDTSIIPQFDTRDPAFYKCNIIISASNGIMPKIFPRLALEQGFENQYEMSFNGLSGFLYYDEEVTQQNAQIKAERALKIIREKFEIDLILLNVTEPNFFPFVAHYPDWSLFLDELLRNVPKDGYWNALDIERLKSEEYNTKRHLSFSYSLINNLDIFEKDIFNSIDQVNFNIASLDLSFLENLEFNDIFSQFFGLNSSLGGINETVSGFEAFNEIFSTFSLSNESHYTTLMIQYEGCNEGIKKVGNEEYSFNLWDAMGYDSLSLRPSEKIFIALIGAFMSDININVLASEIINNTPEEFTLYNFLLEQLQQLLFYADVEIDIESLKDYVFELIWLDNGGIKQSYIRPRNYVDPLDYVNFLPQLGFSGIYGILTGIFNPINQLKVDYKISESEPNLKITKTLVGKNATNGALDYFDFNITAINVGNETAWGVPTHIPFNLDDAFTLIAGPLSQDLMDAIWEVIRVEYPGQYDSLEDFFNFDEDPRIFHFDSLGSGLVDRYFPDLSNLTNLFPYNKDSDYVIDLVTIAYPQLMSGLLVLGITPDDLKETLTNEYSIWNDENWILEPEKKISYVYSNFSISNLDTFSPFFKYNFTIKNTFPELPAVLSGTSMNGTNSTMALLNDNLTWDIHSEEKYIDQHEIEVQFLFQNTTKIDLSNNSIDSVSILINYTDSINVINLEIFNFSSGEFVNIAPYFETIENSTSRYSIRKNRGSLSWLFDPLSSNNHSIVLRIKGTESNAFNISINDLDIEFSNRDINHFTAQGAQVFYSSFSGNVNYVRKSNSISLSTYNMASIISFAEISKYNSEVGEKNVYNIEFENIGSQNAYDLNFSLVNPGLIFDLGNFTIKKDRLNFHLNVLEPLEKSKIQFTFYNPNTILVKSLEISYNSTKKVENLESFKIYDYTNDIFCTAKVDYISKFPFINAMQINFNTSVTNPSITEHFNLTLQLRNDNYSKVNISQLSFYLNDQYGDLKVISGSFISLPGLNYNSLIETRITLKKLDWKAYYYAPINYVNNQDERLLQISKSNPIILGNINLTIVKEIEESQIEIGQTIEIFLRVSNIGNICIKGLILSDVLSFTQIEFSLVEGSLIYEIECLLPGEYISFSYKIKAKSQSLISLKSAMIDFYFLKRNQVKSNEVQVKIIIPKQVQFLFILIPSMVALAILIGYLFEKNRYKSKRGEMKRNEALLFEKEGINSIIKVDKTLKERLNSLSTKDRLSPIPKEDDNNE